MVKHYVPYFQENGIEIEKKCEAGNCMLEPDLFVSLVVNLLENARRAMENGGVIKIVLSMKKMVAICSFRTPDVVFQKINWCI